LACCDFQRRKGFGSVHSRIGRFRRRRRRVLLLEACRLRQRFAPFRVRGDKLRQRQRTRDDADQSQDTARDDRRLHSDRLREAIGHIAPFVGSRPEDLVFVPNVTTGLNAVLRSVPLAAGDEVLVSNLGYGAITIAAGAVTRERGATVRIVEMPDPVRDAGAIVDAISRAIGSRTRLVVVDHITAQTALVLPVAAIVAACHARGVPVLIDGAHAPGSIALDIAAIGADWYSANLHKWAHAPRSCGILWAKPEHQATLRHPVASWGSGGGFHAEFEHNATIDPTSYLAAPEGVAMLREWGFNAVLE
jgi:isopenicillin-N epimerase